ncbi:MAG: hypothetical protein ACRDSK_11195 [Actinophytocola sp.]|uniref:hypothetical protein n=1 Tax=Actinophytocola sp. TaxID=1872138 RepID=UPI003D6B3E3A
MAPAVAQAEAGEWQAAVLPLPAEYPDGLVWLDGTDGHGHYSGTIQHSGGRFAVVLYDGDQPFVAGAPDGCDSAGVSDENSSGLVVGTAYNCENSIYDQAFVYQNGTFSLLTPPGEYTAAQVFGVNDRGDILASVWAPDTTIEPANVVWSPIAAEPIIIHPTLEEQYAVDIDDDGTLLLTSQDGPAIWRDGEVTMLPVPDEYAYTTASAIAGGHVVGSAVSTTTAEEVSLYWPTPASRPQELNGPGRAYHVNRSGLAVGNYPATTWDNGVPAGALPVPKGFSDVQVDGVGDDGTVFGEGGEVTVAPGTPVIWRRD